MLGFLSERFNGLNILILATHPSSDDQPAGDLLMKTMASMAESGLCREQNPGSLKIDHVAAYLELEYPGHRFPAGFSGMIHRKTGGHPLFMTDMIEYLRSRQVISKEESQKDSYPRWSLMRPLTEIEAELPDSMTGMIECRIARIESEFYDTLLAASVRGAEFDSAVLAKALGIDIEKIEARLAAIERDHSLIRLIDECELPCGKLTKRYRFVHQLYQPVLLRAVRQRQRVVLYRAVADAIVALNGDSAETFAHELAALYEAGRSYSRAAEYYQRAAESAVRVHASQEAVQLARQGLKMVRNLPDSTDRTRQELRLLTTLADPLASTMGIASEEFQALYRLAGVLAHRIGDSVRFSLTIQ